MPENFANRYTTTLAAGVTAGALTGTVTTATGAPAVPFRAIISAEGANTDEIVLVTGRTGTTLTWTRAAEAIAGVQAASAHVSGATITAIVTAAQVTRWEAQSEAVSVASLVSGATLPVTVAAVNALLDALKAAGLMANGYSDAMLALSPVAYWRLGEASGTLAADLMNAHDGTYVDTPTLGVTGVLTGDADTAVTLDGVLEHVSVADSTAFRFPATAAFSVTFWMNHTADATFRRVISCENASQQGWMVISQSGEWLARRTGSTGGSQSTGTGTAGSGWVHVVMTYNGTTLTLYRNAVVNGTPAVSAASLPSDSTFKIGTWGGGAVAGFNGSLDEVAVFDRALTPTEIADLYAVGTS